LELHQIVHYINIIYLPGEVVVIVGREVLERSVVVGEIVVLSIVETVWVVVGTC
jgi:hypothetical protein